MLPPIPSPLSLTQPLNAGGDEWQSGVEFSLTRDRLVCPLHSPLTVLHSTPGVSITSSLVCIYWSLLSKNTEVPMHACSGITFKKIEIMLMCKLSYSRKREKTFREWVENKICREKYFMGCSLVSLPKDTTPSILQRKLLRIATKPRNSWKFSPSKVSHYIVISEVYWAGILRYTCFHHTVGASSQLWWCAAATRQLYNRQPTPGKREIG